MTQTEFIECTCSKKSRKRELLQISSERSTDLNLKKKMNLLQTESNDIKIIYQANLKQQKTLQKKVDDVQIFKNIKQLKLQLVQSQNSEIFTRILNSIFVEMISVIKEASDQEIQYVQEISDNFILLNSQFIK